MCKRENGNGGGGSVMFVCGKILDARSSLKKRRVL